MVRTTTKGWAPKPSMQPFYHSLRYLAAAPVIPITIVVQILNELYRRATRWVVTEVGFGRLIIQTDSYVLRQLRVGLAKNFTGTPIDYLKKTRACRSLMLPFRASYALQ